MKKALVVASVGGFIDFEKDNIRRLESLGYEVHVACAKTGWEKYLIDIDEKIIDIPFSRRPFSKKNIDAFKAIRKLIAQEKYQVIHCHTPIAGMLTRLAARKYRKACNVLYTVHGFHFYKGAHVLNWLIYYPVEWICSWFTDVLITINTEDYIFAQNRLHAQKTEYVPGVGVDVESIRNKYVDTKKVKEALGVNDDEIVLLSVGEINRNKNHRVIIESLAKIGNRKLNYYIAGVGDLSGELINLSEQLGVQKQVHFLGYQNDIIALDKSADLFCFPSHREGLSVALMEAIACDIPVICSDIRGNRDLAKNNENVVLFNQNDIMDCAEKIQSTLYKQYSHSNAIMNFSNHIVNKTMKKIYCEIESK